MKILYISLHPNVNMGANTGPGTHIREVVKAFRKRGHQVETLIAGGTVAPEPIMGKTIKKDFFKYLLPKVVKESIKDFLLLRHNRSFFSRIVQSIEQERPDMIYERAYYLCSAGYKAAQKYGIPYIVEMNSPYIEEKPMMSSYSLYHFMAKKVELAQLNAANRFIVVSNILKQYFVKKMPTAVDKIMVIPNAVGSDWRIPDMSRRIERRHRLGIEDDTIVIGFVGSIFPYHGVDLLIDAFSELSHSTLNLRLLIIGDGSIIGQLKSKCRELQISAKVIFTGSVKNDLIPEYLTMMDIAAVVHSNWYGSPTKIFEYGAAGLPIISADEEPIKDVMIDGVHGVLVKPEKSAVKESLVSLINDKEKRLRFGVTFQKKVFAEHNWDRNVDKILEGFE